MPRVAQLGRLMTRGAPYGKGHVLVRVLVRTSTSVRVLVRGRVDPDVLTYRRT